MNINEYLIKPHKQIYYFSCIPSAMEMVLKLHGKVDPNYCQLQNEWFQLNNCMDKPGDNFGKWENQPPSGLELHRHSAVLHPDPRDNRPDSILGTRELYPIIDKELVSGKFVMVSLRGKKDWHIYLIYDKHDDDYCALTKTYYEGERIIYHHDSYSYGVKAHMEREGIADILTYIILPQE